MIRHESSGRAERARGFRTYVPRGIRIRSLKVAGGYSVARWTYNFAFVGMSVKVLARS
jgi:hypothetical protein